MSLITQMPHSEMQEAADTRSDPEKGDLSGRSADAGDLASKLQWDKSSGTWS